MADNRGMLPEWHDNRNPFYRDPGAPNAFDEWFMQLLGAKSPIDRRGPDFGVPPAPEGPGFWDAVLNRIRPTRPALRAPGPPSGAHPGQYWRRG